MSTLCLKMAPLSEGVLAIGLKAAAALEVELALYPKPGLVSPIDNGAHSDMDASTFIHSIAVLKSYFIDIATAGVRAARFEFLQDLGIAAEQRMLVATRGVNTHRGAIFSLGLLAAAAGWRYARDSTMDGEGLAETVVQLWGNDIARAGAQYTDSNGSRAVRLYGAQGARAQALNGFATLVGTAIPVLEKTLSQLHCTERALVQCLFAVMAELDDTNLLHRGGQAGLAFVQKAAHRFLADGGVYRSDWRTEAIVLHHTFSHRHLSPGGAADILSAAWFVHSLTPRS